MGWAHDSVHGDSLGRLWRNDLGEGVHGRRRTRVWRPSTGFATVVGSGTTNIAATTDGVTGSTTLAFTVIPAPRITVSSDTVAFFGGVAGTPPAPQILQVTNGGGGKLGGLVTDVQFGPGQPTGWLTPVLATTQSPTTLTLTPQTATLPLGVYNAIVTLASANDYGSPLLILVTLTLTGDQ